MDFEIKKGALTAIIAAAVKEKAAKINITGDVALEFSNETRSESATFKTKVRDDAYQTLIVANATIGQAKVDVTLGDVLKAVAKTYDKKPEEIRPVFDNRVIGTGQYDVNHYGYVFSGVKFTV